jgi:hypothetical protein
LSENRRPGLNPNNQISSSKQIPHDRFVTRKPQKEFPSSLMAEGAGGGEHFNSVPPHLNPLPPGERRFFYAITIAQSSNSVWSFEFGH